MNDLELMSMSEVKKAVRLKTTAFYLLRKSGRFPQPTVATSSKHQLWLLKDVAAYLSGEWKPDASDGEQP